MTFKNVEFFFTMAAMKYLRTLILDSKFFNSSVLNYMYRDSNPK